MTVELNKLENRWKSIMYRIHLILILKPSASIQVKGILPSYVFHIRPLCLSHPSRHRVSESGAVVPGQPRSSWASIVCPQGQHGEPPFGTGARAPGRCQQVPELSLIVPRVGRATPGPSVFGGGAAASLGAVQSVTLPFTISSRMGSRGVLG